MAARRNPEPDTCLYTITHKTESRLEKVQKLLFGQFSPHAIQYLPEFGAANRKWMRRECCPSGNQSPIKISGQFLESQNRRGYALPKKHGNFVLHF